MATNYTQPPPLYTGPKSNTNGHAQDEAEQPLLSTLSPGAGPSSGAYYDQPEVGDIPDDFKVSKEGLLQIEERYWY